MNHYLITYTRTYSAADVHSKIIKADNPEDAGGLLDKQIAGDITITDCKMITDPETTYTVLKNHLHNTLQLTKKDIRKMVEEAVENIVERRLDVFLNYETSIERIIDDAVRKKSWSSLLWSDAKQSIYTGPCECKTCSGYCGCTVKGHHGRK